MKGVPPENGRAVGSNVGAWNSESYEICKSAELAN
jgi:hypothetical protein